LSDPTKPPAKPRRSAYDRAMRANRIFARMLEGQSYAAIAEAEALNVRRVREIVQQALDRFDIEPSREYALVQIARLDAALRLIERKIADGKLSAVPHLIKVLEQLDRYHGERLYEPPPECRDKDRAIAVRLKMERLAANRAAVSMRLAAPDLPEKRPPRNEIVA
jgi:hypothetical protein